MADSAKPTKPKEYESVPDDLFAIPEEYKYPMDTPERARAALHYWGVHKGDYSPEDQAKIEARMKRLAAKVGVEAKFSADIYVEVLRDAKLFEAGVYPDRDVEVTEGDLDRIVGNFEEVPIKVEHHDSPLHLGGIKKLWREGKELFGTLAFPRPAWELIKHSDARKLSVSMPRDKSRLVEVSVVRSPRIADARIFALEENDAQEVVALWFTSDLPEDAFKSDEAEGDGSINSNETREVIDMSEKINEKPSGMDYAEALRIVRDFTSGKNEEVDSLRDSAREMVEYAKATEDELKRAAGEARAAILELQKANTDRLLEKYRREGKLPKACEPLARAILLSKPLASATPDEAQTLSFSDETGKDHTLHFAEVFVSFMELMPPVVSFQELARQRASEGEDVPERTREFLKRNFGLSDEDIAKYANR